MEPSSLSSPLLTIITVMVLLITSTLSDDYEIPPVPVPLKIVPSNEIPTGYCALDPEPKGKCWVFGDEKNLPNGIQQIILANNLPSRYSIVIPKNAEKFGYTTELIPYPSALSQSPTKKDKPPGLRSLGPPPLGKVLVLTTPTRLLIAPPLKTGYSYTFPIKPLKGMTLESEYITPYVPPPLKIVSKNADVPSGMKVMPKLDPNYIGVFKNASNPKLLTMLPIIPSTMKLLVPKSGDISVESIKYPKELEVVSRATMSTSTKVKALPVPNGMGEVLIMWDKDDPTEEVVQIARPPEGMVNAKLKASPDRIKFTVMTEDELVKFLKVRALRSGTVLDRINKTKSVVTPIATKTKPTTTTKQTTKKPINQIVQAKPAVVQVLPDFDINAFIANLPNLVPKPTTTTKKPTTKRLPKIPSELSDFEFKPIKQAQLIKDPFVQDNSINENSYSNNNIDQYAYNSQPQQNTVGLESLQGEAIPDNLQILETAIDNYEKGGGYQQAQQIETEFENTGQDYQIDGYNSMDNSKVHLSNIVVDQQGQNEAGEEEAQEIPLSLSDKRVLEVIKMDAGKNLKKPEKFSSGKRKNKKRKSKAGMRRGGDSPNIVQIFQIFLGCIFYMLII